MPRLLSVVLLLLTASPVWAEEGNVISFHCPCCRCRASGPIFAYYREKATDQLLFVRLVKCEHLGENWHSTFEITEVLHSRFPPLQIGQQVIRFASTAGAPGDLFLLGGITSESGELQWYEPVPVNALQQGFIRKLPPVSAGEPALWKYYLQHIRSEDLEVRMEVQQSLFDLPLADLKRIQDALSPQELEEALRQALVEQQANDGDSDPQGRAEQIRLCGLLLGLCGRDAETRLLEQLTLDHSQARIKPRSGIEGVMVGYLLLTGESGLQKLVQQTITPRYLHDARGEVMLDDQGQPVKMPFSEQYAAIQAIRYLWHHGHHQLSSEQLCLAVYPLLDNPDWADLVIADLTRWQDWSVMDRLMKMYDTEEFNNRSVKKAISRYMFVAARGRDQAGEPTATARQAEQYRLQLEQKDPELYQQATRFLPLLNEQAGPQP